MKILIADSLSSTVKTYLNQPPFELMEAPTLKGDSLLEAMRSFQPEVLVVRSTKVTADHILGCNTLALIIRAGAGVNNIEMKTASKQGVFVANCPGRNAIAVAELAMGHLINLDRRISDNVADFRSGIWGKKKYSSAKGLYEQTLAIFGLGAVGRELMLRAQAFGIKVRVWSVPFTQEEAESLGVTFAASPQEAARGADILSIHLPLLPETRGLVNADLLSSLNDSAYIINTSRGELIDEDALLQAIENKGIRAGLDVFCDEPAASDTAVSSPLCTSPSVYVTHHIGASTDQSIESVGRAVISIIRGWCERGVVQNCVNLARSSPATHCLSIRHADQVGVLASVLDLLKSEGYNIQEMENIIFQGGKAACARIQIEGAPSHSLIEKIDALSNVYAASLIHI